MKNILYLGMLNLLKIHFLFKTLNKQILYFLQPQHSILLPPHSYLLSLHLIFLLTLDLHQHFLHCPHLSLPLLYNNLQITCITILHLILFKSILPTIYPLNFKHLPFLLPLKHIFKLGLSSPNKSLICFFYKFRF